MATHGRLFWLRDMKLLKERVQSISQQIFTALPREYGYYGNKRIKVTNYNMIHDKLPKEEMYKRKFSLALEEFS